MNNSKSIPSKSRYEGTVPDGFFLCRRYKVLVKRCSVDNCPDKCRGRMKYYERNTIKNRNEAKNIEKIFKNTEKQPQEDKKSESEGDKNRMSAGTVIFGVLILLLSLIREYFHRIRTKKTQ